MNKIKMVLGFGINDCDYAVKPVINGKRVVCEYYQTWRSMLFRCYSESYLKRFPTYRECSVCDEWKSFVTFKIWMEQQDWKNKELDKDILIPGNKVYSPKACCFVSQKVNSLLVNNSSVRGLLPQGVTRHSSLNKYVARVSVDGDRKYLGVFDTPEGAYIEYCRAKIDNIIRTAQTQPEPIRSGLLRHAELFNNNEEHKQ